ncbi:CRISPR-associated endonuclease Cas2 [Akkermansiaceae bacterium]|nr:CRISPR-associated endonuclease Cas2 [Akkermansiaceae bacterium]
MPRTRYLVSYDIANPKRLRQVAKTCESFGSRIQYSVFECPLDDLRLANLRAALHILINHDEDQILFVSLGQESSSSPFRIESLGQPYTERSRVTII